MRQIKKIDIDFVIIGLSALIFIGALTLLIKSDFFFNISKNNTSLEQIAYLEDINNDIRIKYSNEINWIPVSKQSDLYNEQMVFSGDNSSAQIKFKKGESFNLAPQSMILITQLSENETTLDLKKGSLTGSLSNNVSLKVDDQKIMVKDNIKSEIKVIKTKKRSTIQLKSGSVKLTDKSGIIKEKIDNNGQLTIEDKKVSKTKIIHRLISPINSSKVWVSKNSQIQLKWSSIDKKKDYIQFSKNTNFKNAIELETTSSTLLIDENNLQCSFCYWRIVRKDISGKINYQSISENFQILKNIAPQIVSPKNNSIVTLDVKDKQVKTKVMLSWESNKYIKGYEVQISSDDKKVKAQKILTTKENKILYELEKQNYFWRIRGIRNDSNTTPWSNISSFKVGNFDEVRTVKLISPGTDSNFTALDFPYELTLNWMPIGIKGKYEVLVSNTPNFEENKFKTFISKTENIKIKLSKPGKYFWKIRFIGKDKAYSPISETFSFKIEEYEKLPPIEIEIEKLNFEVNNSEKFIKKLWDTITNFLISRSYAKENSLNVNWNAVEGAIGYQVELSKDSSFSEIIIKKKIKSPNFSIKKISPGSYFWRVSAIDKNSVVGSPSKAIPLVIKFKELAPLIKEQIKAKNVNANGITEETIKWTGSRYCKKYNLKIYRSNGKIFKSAIVKKSYWTNELPINTKLYWKVSCLSQGNKVINSSQKIPLYLKYPRQYQPPKLISPSNQIFNHFEEQSFNISFKWSDVKGAKKYRLIIFQNENIDEPIYDTEVENSTPIITLPQEIEGTLKWRVQTIGEESYSKPSKIESFNVVKRKEVQINYLTPSVELITTTMKKPNINFSWEDIKTKYLFTLAKDSDFDNVLLKKIISKPYIKIKLPPANYYWKVQSVVKDEYTNGTYFRLSKDYKEKFVEIHRVEKRFFQVTTGGGAINSNQDINSLNSEIFKGKGSFPVLDFDLSFANYPILKNWGWLARLNYKNSTAPLESQNEKETVIQSFLDYELQLSYNLFRPAQYHFYGHLGYYSLQFLYSGSKNNQLELNTIDMQFLNIGINMFKRFNNIIFELHSGYLKPISNSTSNGFNAALSTLYDFETFSFGLKFNQQNLNISSDDFLTDVSSDKITTSHLQISLLYRNRF